MKETRHKKIIEIVTSNKVETQEELAERLNASGIKVTQATVSRDIKELKLCKALDNDGTQYYQMMAHVGKGMAGKYTRVLREGLVSMDTAGNLLVISTMSGMANAVAAALDQFRFEKIVGTLAGDDTIMCAMKNPADANYMLIQLKAIIGD